MLLALFLRICAAEADETRQWRMAELVQVNGPQINDNSVQQQCAEGYFRKHTSFNLELDGLQQRQQQQQQ